MHMYVSYLVAFWLAYDLDLVAVLRSHQKLLNQLSGTKLGPFGAHQAQKLIYELQRYLVGFVLAV